MEAGNIGQGAVDVVVALGEGVAVGLTDAGNDSSAVGLAVGGRVGWAVRAGRGVAVGPAVAVRPGVVDGLDAAVRTAVDMAVGAVSLALVSVAAVIEAEADPLAPVGPDARPIPDPSGLRAGFPDQGAHWANAIASTTMPKRAAARTRRSGVRMGPMLWIGGAAGRPTNVPKGRAFRTWLDWPRRD